MFIVLGFSARTGRCSKFNLVFLEFDVTYVTRHTFPSFVFSC